MKKFNATVKVKLKPIIKDTKALILEKPVINVLDVQNLKCRVGNIYSLEFDAENDKQAEKIVQTISEEILSNSVIEEYEIIW